MIDRSEGPAEDPGGDAGGVPGRRSRPGADASPERPPSRPMRALVAASVALYGVALVRYPSTFRRRYGARMRADFGRLLAEEVRRSRLRGWIRVCGRIARDLVRPLPPALREAVPSPRPPKRRGPVRALAADVRAGWHALARRPGFTLLVVGVLGVGIALNATIFSVVDAYLLRPLPYPQAERLVEVRPATSAVGWTNSADVFEKAVSWHLDGFTLVGDPGPEIVLGARVTPDFFDVYGVRPVLGRAFGPDDVGEGGARVAVIGHALWTSRFGGDPGVIGRTIHVFPSDDRDGLESLTIVGVLPSEFWYLNGYTNILTPMSGPGPVYVGRLRTDVPPERAHAVLSDRAREAGMPGSDQEGVRVRPLQEAYTASVRPPLLALQGAALLVLVAAAASAALLVLVRASGRTREMSVRRALGAGGGRLATHLFAESLLLAFAAGAVGLALGRAGLGALGTLIEARLGRRVPGGTAALHLDVSAVLAVLAAGTVVAFVLGAVSVATASRGSLATGLAGGGRGGATTAGAARFRGVLVATQVALCVALLAGGALLVRSSLHLQAMQLGFDPDGLEDYTVGLTTERADDVPRRTAFFEELRLRARALPGVTSAGLLRAVPLTGGLTTRAIEVEGRGAADALPEAVPQIASAGAFETLGLEAEHGRLFTPDDGPGATPVSVVDASLAVAIAPPGSPAGGAVGVRIRFTAWTMPEMELRTGPWTTVVGVVPDVADEIGGAHPTLYVPYLQAPSTWMDLLIRRRPGWPPLTQEVRALVRDLDENTPVYETQDVAASVRAARAPARFFAGLLGGFALFALGLALAGLYGVAAYAARQRRRDLAVRLALGATPASVEWLFVRGAAITVAAGLAVGLAGARALGGALRAQLHGVDAHDPATLAAVATLVTATAVLAVWIPARGAARLEVSQLLRDE